MIDKQIFYNYTYKQKASGIFQFGRYEIYFKDDKICTLSGYNKDQVHRIVGLLNGAYALGYSDRELESFLA